MADKTGVQLLQTDYQVPPCHAGGIVGFVTPTTLMSIYFYQMRGKTLSSTYVYWTRMSSPDFSGAYAPEPVTNIVLARSWTSAV